MYKIEIETPKGILKFNIENIKSNIKIVKIIILPYN